MCGTWMPCTPMSSRRRMKAGSKPGVRTPGFDPAFILRLLDMGVQGIQVPHISDARAAREAVKAVRYAPLGDRGMAGAAPAAGVGANPPHGDTATRSRRVTPRRRRRWR